MIGVPNSQSIIGWQQKWFLVFLAKNIEILHIEQSKYKRQWNQMQVNKTDELVIMGMFKEDLIRLEVPQCLGDGI